jgi:hypothetical protein
MPRAYTIKSNPIQLRANGRHVTQLANLLALLHEETNEEPNRIGLQGTFTTRSHSHKTNPRDIDQRRHEQRHLNPNPCG